MRFSAVVTASITVLSSTVQAVGYAKVINKCTFPLYAWSVDPETVGPRNNLVASTGAYQETYRADGGISIKITRKKSVNSLYDGSPVMQFQYTLDDAIERVWYSLADSNGDILAGYKVAVRPSAGSSCPRIVWPEGSGASAIYNCGEDTNLVLTLCAA